MRRSAVLALALVCLAAGVATAPGTATGGPTHADVPSPPNASDAPSPSNASTEPRIAAVHPNPIADEDRGEFVVLEFPAPTNLSGWRLDDGETTVRLPNRTVEGSIAVSPEPAAARNLTDHPVRAIEHLRLSNAGETVRLRHRGVVVDAVAYADAPGGEVYRVGGTHRADERYRTDGTHRAGEWHPIGATNRSVAVTDPESVEAFVLPDAPGVPVAAVGSADRRILLAGYTLTSERIAAELRRAARRGVEVRVLVDAAPVGGMPRREARVLDSLVDAGAEVRVFGGEGAPYAFHHPKYAVVDDRALVLTENFKPAGTGGRSSRGWGAVVDDPDLAAELAAVFRADARDRGSTPWSAYRDNASFVESERADGHYPSRFAPRELEVERARVLVAPDNAERALVETLDGAERSIRVEQATLERGPLLNATLRAARRGVEVRILLSGAWYAREENRRLVEELNRRADREGLDLEARIADPRSRFGKIHAKGAIVDGRAVVLGSLNWNDHSPDRNREVVVVLSGEAVGRYYGRVFRADWRGGAWRLPAGLAIALVLSVVLAGGIGMRRVEFDPG